jgi:hypothetical protein
MLMTYDIETGHIDAILSKPERESLRQASSLAGECPAVFLRIAILRYIAELLQD